MLPAMQQGLLKISKKSSLRGKNEKTAKSMNKGKDSGLKKKSSNRMANHKKSNTEVKANRRDSKSKYKEDTKAPPSDGPTRFVAKQQPLGITTAPLPTPVTVAPSLHPTATTAPTSITANTPAGANDSSQSQLTLFENVDDARPAIVKEQAYKLKWKEGFDPIPLTTKERIGKEDADNPLTDQEKHAMMALLTSSMDFRVLCRILSQSRDGNLLEALPSEEESAVIKQYLEGNCENSRKEQDAVFLLTKAMELCYNRIVFEAYDFNLILDEDCRNFLADHQKAKSRFLDAILTIPEFLPLQWGGKVVHLRDVAEDENINRYAKSVVEKVQKKETKMRAYGLVKMCKEAEREKHAKERDEKIKHARKEGEKEKERKDGEKPKEDEKDETTARTGVSIYIDINKGLGQLPK